MPRQDGGEKASLLDVDPFDDKQRDAVVEHHAGDSRARDEPEDQDEQHQPSGYLASRSLNGGRLGLPALLAVVFRLECALEGGVCAPLGRFIKPGSWWTRGRDQLRFRGASQVFAPLEFLEKPCIVQQRRRFGRLHAA
jgi:hypothetical protein